MEAEALQKIIDLVAVSMKDEDTGHIHQPYLKLPGGVKLESLERFMEVPYRQRGTFKTDNPTAFAQYVNQHARPGGGGTHIFIDRKDMTAKAIIDHQFNGGADWGDHRAILSLNPTPEYNDLLKHHTITLSQAGWIEWMENNIHVIEFYKGDIIGDNIQPIETVSAFQAFKNLKVESSTDLTSVDIDHHKSTSKLEQMDIKSNIVPALPTYFRWIASPYYYLSEKPINCRLIISQKDDKFTVRYRMVGHEQMRDACATEFSNLLSSSFETDLPIWAGEYLPIWAGEYTPG